MANIKTKRPSILNKHGDFTVVTNYYIDSKTMMEFGVSVYIITHFLMISSSIN